MFFRMVLFIWEFVLDVAAVCRLTESEKDLEIRLLRQQLRIVERKQDRGPQIPRGQKVPLFFAWTRENVLSLLDGRSSFSYWAGRSV